MNLSYILKILSFDEIFRSLTKILSTIKNSKIDEIFWALEVDLQEFNFFH